MRKISRFEKAKNNHTENETILFYHFQGVDDVSLKFLAQVDKQTKWLLENYAKFLIAFSSVSLILIPTASLLLCLTTKGVFDVHSVYHLFKVV